MTITVVVVALALGFAAGRGFASFDTWVESHTGRHRQWVDRALLIARLVLHPVLTVAVVVAVFRQPTPTGTRPRRHPEDRNPGTLPRYYNP